MNDDNETKRVIYVIWMLVVVAVALLAGGIGWSLRTRSTLDRYIQALVEKHEAATRYWNTRKDDIITNNTLRLRSGEAERKQRDGKKAN